MNKRKGISLIVLVITILVMIILAGVVVVSLQKNNPIEKAKEATFKNNVASYKDELSLAVATRSSNGIAEKINAGEADIKNYIPSITKEDTKKFSIIENKLAYIGDVVKEDALAGEIGVLACGKGKSVFIDQNFGENGQEIDASQDRNQAIELRPGSNPIKSWGPVALEFDAKPTRETFFNESQFGDVNNWRPDQNTIIHPHTGSKKEEEVFIGVNLGTNGIQIIEHANDWYPFSFAKKGDFAERHKYKVIINDVDVYLFMDGEFLGKYTSSSPKVGLNFNKIGGGIYGGFKGVLYSIKVVK